jgi:hypothetical protein
MGRGSPPNPWLLRFCSPLQFGVRISQRLVGLTGSFSFSLALPFTPHYFASPTFLSTPGHLLC